MYVGQSNDMKYTYKIFNIIGAPQCVYLGGQAQESTIEIPAKSDTKREAEFREYRSKDLQLRVPSTGTKA